MKKKVLVLLLCVMLLIGLLPSAAFAQEETAEVVPELTEEQPRLNSPESIPTCTAKTLTWNGDVRSAAEFFEEEIMGRCTVQSEVQLCDAGEYRVTLRSPEGYVFAEPDDAGAPELKTFTLTIAPYRIAAAHLKSLPYDGQEHGFTEFIVSEEAQLASEYADYTVLYDDKGAYITGGSATVLKDPGTYTVLMQIKEDYRQNVCFAEPFDDGEKLHNELTKYSVTIVPTFVVHFDLSGLDFEPADQRVVRDGLATDPKLSVEGYELIGWYKEKTQDGFFGEWNFETDTITKDTTIYGDIREIFDVSFVTYGIGGNQDWTVQVRQGERVNRPQPPHALADGTLEDPEGHYTFLGWANANEEPWYFIEDAEDVGYANVNKVMNDLAIYAVWEADKHNVTFDVQGHGIAPDPLLNVDYGSKITKPADPTEKGWQFMGWYKDPACTDAWNFDTDVIQGDTILYAKWLKLYTVTFKSNGHGTAPKSQTVVEGGKVTKPANPTAKGYYFIGWYKEKTCVNQWKFATDVVTADTVLYAKWSVNNPKTGDEDDNLRFYAMMAVIALGTAAVVICGNVKKRDE